MRKYLYKENIRGFKHWLFNLNYIGGLIGHIFWLAILFFLTFIKMDIGLKALVIFFLALELFLLGFFIWHVAFYKIRISEKNLSIKRPGLWWTTIYITIAKIRKVELFNIENFGVMDMDPLVFFAPYWGNWKKRTAIVQKGSAVKIFTEDKEYVISTNYPEQLKSVVESMIIKNTR